MTTVLIVEDDSGVRTYADVVLRNGGYETICASNVAEALELIETGQPFDLLYTDICLGSEPDGGVKVSDALSRARPGLPVLYTTGANLTDAMVRAFSAPRSVLPKPYTPRQLLAAVNLLTCGGFQGAATARDE